MSLERVVKFAGVSGAGLCLDYLIYVLLCGTGMDAGPANAISAGTAVTFVFVVSARHIFEADARHGFLVRPFAVYAAFQVVAVLAASALVHATTDLLGGAYVLGKTVVLPLTFTVNYLFMTWLMSSTVEGR